MAQRANRALRDEDYDRAWITWQGIARIHPKQRDVVNAGLAETLFRRALNQQELIEGVKNLQQAVELAPKEARYHYHLGLMLHRAGRPKAALKSYKRAYELGFDPERLGYPWALASLEAGNRQHLALARPLVSDPMQQAALDAVAGLQRNQPDAPPPVNGAASYLDCLWIAFAHLARNEREAALTALQAAEKRPRGGCPAEVEAIRRYYLGVLAAAEGDLEAAEAHWRAALAVDWRSLLDFGSVDSLQRNLGYLYRQRAVAALERGDYAEALACTQTGLKQGLRDRILAETGSLAAFHLGNQAAEAGNWQKALRYWQDAYQLKPSRQLALNLGLAYERLERWHEAAEYWREMVRRRPRRKDHPDYLSDQQVVAVWQRVAYCYQRAENPMEAAVALGNAVKYAPDDLDLRLALAQAQLAAGKDRAALNTVQKVLRENPQHVPALKLAAEIRTARGEQWLAVPYWEQILELEPDNRDARRYLCEYYEQQGNNYMHWGYVALAIQSYEKGLAIDPTNAALLGSMALAYAEQGDREEALDYVQKAIEHAGSVPDGYVYAVRTLALLGDVDTALHVAQTAQERVPNLAPGFYIDLGLSVLDYGEEELFAEFLDMAKVLADDEASFYVAVGSGLMTLNRWDLAEDILQEGLNLDPQNSELLMLLGVVYARTGRLKAARKAWQKAKRLAHKKRDHELVEAIEAAEILYGSGVPSGLLDMIMRAMALEEGILDDDFPFDF